MERRLKQFALGLPAAMLIGASAVLHAAPASEPDLATALATPDLKTYDKNGDGFVSMDEAKAHGIDARTFNEADESKDGRLDADELTKAVAIDDRARASKYIGDAWITTKVKTLLVKDTGLPGF